MFGEVAETYDRARPGYPPALVDDVIGLARLGDGDRVLEVGSGTGKATVQFAARGLAMTCLEPSESMAAVARRNCEHFRAAQPRRIEFVALAGRDRRTTAPAR